MPAASHVEKEGTFTQTQRMLQWRDKAVEPPGDQRSELWFFYHLGRRLKEKLAGSTDERDRPLLDLAWDYATEDDAGDEPSGRRTCCGAINGFDLRTGQTAQRVPRPRRPTAAPPAAAGSTAACTPTGSTRRPAASRDTEQGRVRRRVGLGLAAEPADAVQPRVGRPGRAARGASARSYVWWDAREAASGPATTCPDFEQTKPPTTGRPRAPAGRRRCAGDDPFIMQADGKGWLFAPSGLVDGPLPTHYEPHESPVRNPLYGQQANPTRKVYGRPDNPSNPRPPERAQRGLPVRVHHRPAHRAPHRRRHEPASCRTCPSCSRSCSSRCPRSWPPSAAWRTWLGARDHQPHGDRGPGAGHRPDDAAAGRRPRRAPDLAALPLGHDRAGHRRLGQRPVRRGPRPERASSRRARSPPATSSPDAGRAARRCPT